MQNKKILIVDDEENVRMLFKEELEDEGYTTDLASNGYEAIEKVKNNSYDVVILDIKMPGIDGIQTLNEIKKININQPVILCSAYGEFRQDFASWASDAYVVKSADMSELKEIIANILKKND